MKTHPFVLESPLSLQECIHRLQSSISPQGMSFFAVWDSGNKEFHGTIDENSIELRKRKSWFWKNDFAPHLFAQLHPTPSGTRIEGHFSISSKVAMFMTIWLVAVAGFGVAFVIQSLITGFSDHAWLGVLIPLGMVAWGFILPRIGYYFSYWHEDELLEFVRTTLMISA